MGYPALAVFLFSLIIFSACGNNEVKKYRIGVSQCSGDYWRVRTNEDMQRELLLHDDVELDDSGVFDGFYRSSLPSSLPKGSILKLNVFFDHSILDIFINDTWASSVRVFANEKAVEKATVFADYAAEVKKVEAWKLGGSNGSGVSMIGSGKEVSLTSQGSSIIYSGATVPSTLRVYDFAGRKVMETFLTEESGSVATSLKGIHIATITSPTSTTSTKLLF